MADALNAATKYVVTSRSQSLPWHPVEAIGPDVVEDVRRLRSQEAPPLHVWGSSTLTSPLLAHGLVSELILIVYPVIVGEGKRLFPEPTAAHTLHVAHATPLASGVTVTRYTVDGPMIS